MKRKETTDLFDSEDMQAAFINVRQSPLILEAMTNVVGFPLVTPDPIAALGI